MRFMVQGVCGLAFMFIRYTVICKVWGAGFIALRVVVGL